MHKIARMRRMRSRGRLARSRQAEKTWLNEGAFRGGGKTEMLDAKLWDLLAPYRPPNRGILTGIY